jgi:hypothetical protein
MRPARTRLAVFSAVILAVLTAVLAVLLPTGTASAATRPAAETRVWASASATQVHVRAGDLVSAGERLGDPASCPFWVSGSCAAPEAAGGGTTALFRVVGSAEARDIAGSGVFRNPAGLEGKYFYPTQEQAVNLAGRYAKLGINDQMLTSGRISNELLQQLGEPITPAGEGPAFFLRNEVLPYINDVTIHGPVP